jgi:hypothetical protein
MQAQRWTRWGLRTNRKWPTAQHSAARRRSSLKARISRAATVSRTIDLASMPPGVFTQEEPRNGR